MSAMPRPRPCESVSDSCWSSSSVYMRLWSVSSSPSPSFASRIDFIMMPIINASNCCATARSVAGSCGAAPAADLRPSSPWISMKFCAPAAAAGGNDGAVGGVGSVGAIGAVVIDGLDHDQFGVQRAGLLQRLEYRDEVAGRRADLVDGADDLIERHARLEQEHAAALLLHVDRRVG